MEAPFFPLMVCFHCPTPIPIPILIQMANIIMCRTVSTEPIPIPILYSGSYSNADGYDTQFDTDISTDKVFFKVIFIVTLHQNDHWNRS